VPFQEYFSAKGHFPRQNLGFCNYKYGITLDLHLVQVWKEYTET